METRLFEVKTKDGRTFRVFCENKSQIQRIYDIAWDKLDATTDVISTGIHTIKQFEEIAKTL